MREAAMSMRFALAVAAVLAAETSAPAQTVLLRDDFTGSSLSASNWNVADWTFGGNRAYFGATPAVANGFARLTLDTYNAAHPGFFRGSEIYSGQSFARGTTGIEFETRARTNMTTRGAVTSFFTYTSANNRADEIDFEFLTNQVNGSNHRVLTTSWNDWGAPGSNYNDNVYHRSTNPAVAGLDLTQFNTFTIRWLPDRIDWLVNGALVSSWASPNPDAAAPIRMNFWAPDSGWADAYDAGLQPTTIAANNQTFTYDVDYVEVRTFNPVPEPAGLLAVAAATLVWLRRRVGA